MRRLAPWLAPVLVAGCTRVSAFECDGDQQCVDGEVVGQCEASGYCSFPDLACASGRRYGDRAGDGLAGECVDVDAGTTSGDPSTTVGATSLEVTSVDPSSADTSAGSLTTPVTSEEDTAVIETGSGCPSDWHDCGFAFRRRLTPSPLPGASVQDFPVRLGLSASFAWAHADQAGSDVRFFGADGTPYPHEIEVWQPDEAATIWIRLPTLGDADDQDLWMYYGSDAPTAPLDPAEVWSNGYIAVWHLGDALDSTGSFELVAENTATVEGRIGLAQAFDGATARMTADGLVDPFEAGGIITAWIRPDSWGVNGYGRIACMRISTPTSAGWSFHLNGVVAPVNSLRMSELQGTTQQQVSTAEDTIALGQWRWVGLSHRRSAPVEAHALYLDGAVAETVIAEMGNGPATEAMGPFTIGALAGGDNRHFDGIIDELRVASEIRDAAWLAYEYASVESELLMMSDEEAQ